VTNFQLLPKADHGDETIEICAPVLKEALYRS
jgi:hypothetical protein